jgi:lipid-binding SYLF domain-containing protein
MKKILYLALLTLGVLTAPAMAGEPELLVTKAITTVERLRTDEHLSKDVNAYLQRARGVLIVPDLVKGGFIFGAEYGTGVMLTRDPTGSWSAPAFYTVGGGSIGLQIGIQDSETMFIIMNDKGLEAIMNNNFKAGAGVSISVGMIGAGAEAATTKALGADIHAYSKGVGLYGGGTFEGTAITPKHTWNTAYFKSELNPADILISRMVDNPHAQGLKAALAAP